MIMGVQSVLLGLALAMSAEASEPPEPSSSIEQVDVVTGSAPAAMPDDLAARVTAFRKRAIMLKKVTVAEAMATGKQKGPAGMMQTPRANIIVVNGDGQMIPDDQLGAMVKDKNLAMRYLWMNRQEALMGGMRVGAIGMLISSLPVGAVLGLLAGGAIGIPLAIMQGSVMTGVAGAGIGLGIGAVVGVVVGAVWFACNVAIGMEMLFYSYYTRSMFYAGAVREHNTQLAQELGVSPAEVGIEYFPSDRPPSK